MRKYLIFHIAIALGVAAQSQSYETVKVPLEGKNFSYLTSDAGSESVVILFHDWFGISDLSFEMMERINTAGMDAIAMDIYQGKRGTNNAEAQRLMNTVDVDAATLYIDQVLAQASEEYRQIFLWCFSLGTVPGSQAAIRHAEHIDGLVLFYGNTPRDPADLAKMKFPSLMVMGSKDNPNGAIAFFNALNKETTYATLYIHPNVGHAFAQLLFNGGMNYREKAKETTFAIAFDFISDILEHK